MRLFLLSAFCLMPLLAGAQAPQGVAPVWHIDSMQGSAAVILFHKDSARVQKGSNMMAFRILKQGRVVQLADKKTDGHVLLLLGTPAEAINLQYGPDRNNLLPTEKLLTAAAGLPEGKLVLEGSSPTVPATSDSDEYAAEEPVAATPEKGDSMPWLYPALAAVGGLLLGLGIGRSMRKQKPQPASAPLSPARPKSFPYQEKMWQQETALRQQFAEEAAREDKRLYQPLFDQVLLPLQEGMERQDGAAVVAELVRAATLLNSLTRHKLAKKGQYDEQNLALLTEGSAISNSPLITGATPPDQVPQHLRKLLSLLKAHGVKSLGDLVVGGYRFQDLS